MGFYDVIKGLNENFYINKIKNLTLRNISKIFISAIRQLSMSSFYWATIKTFYEQKSYRRKIIKISAIKIFSQKV